LTRLQLIETLTAYARKHNCQPDERYDNRIQFGFVGFPNVGKSSVINVLMGSSKHAHGVTRVAVAAQPGKTKHFQTLLLPDSDELMLCDCPGLVFPSFVSNTADLIAAGVYPIAQMRDHWPVIHLICQRIPRDLLNAHYGIHIHVPSELEMREHGWTQVPPPTGEIFLGTLCVARSILAASSGVPDYARAARMVIVDYAEGKLLYCHAPPNETNVEAFYKETLKTAMLHARKKREIQMLEKLNQEDDGQDEEDYLDDDLLDLAGGGDESGLANRGRQRNKHKWGKKNRKNRDKDPYGCHITVDDLLKKNVASGVVVNAGKHSWKGYTRPTTYGSARIQSTVPAASSSSSLIS
jgi:large subunit GTPase 1